MFSIGHFLSGLVLYGSLSKLGVAITPMDGFLLAVSTVLIPDLDYAIYWNKHRKSFFHTPLFGLLMLVGGFLLVPYQIFILGLTISKALILISVGILLHLILDSIDFGVMWLYPFDKKLYGLKLLRTGPQPFKNYIKTYYSNKYMRNLEIVFLVLTLALTII